MKKLLLSAAVLSAVGLNAQNEPAVKTEKAVGIETTEPRATLDVNGDARLQKVELMTASTPTTEIFPDCPCVLTIDKFGVIHRIPKDQFVLASGSTSGSPGSGVTTGGGTQTNPGGGQGGGPSNGGGKGNVGGEATFGTLSNAEAFVISYDLGNTANEKHQGKVTSEEIPVKIPYTGGSTNKTVEETIIASTTIPNLKLKIKAGTISSASGELDAVIYHENGEYDITQITLAEVQSGNYKKEIATFQVQVNGVAQPATVTLNALGGIPDKNFGDGDHNFLYLPVTVAGTHPVNGKPYVKKWLNMNLGAEAAKVGSPHFNMLIKKYGYDRVDDALTGSFFQYKRPADGHELWNSPVTYIKGSDWTGKNPTSIIGKFVGAEDGQLWTTANDTDDSLWGPNGPNNPCPTGYHVPSRTDWEELAIALTNKKHESDDKMYRQTKLPNLNIVKSRGGKYHHYGVSPSISNYWTSSGGNYEGRGIGKFSIANSSYIVTSPSFSVQEGYAIRCVQD